MTPPSSVNLVTTAFTFPSMTMRSRPFDAYFSPNFGVFVVVAGDGLAAARPEAGEVK